MSQNDDKSLIEIIEHLAARIEGYSMDLHRRIDMLDTDLTEVRAKLDELLEEIEEIIGEEL